MYFRANQRYLDERRAKAVTLEIDEDARESPEKTADINLKHIETNSRTSAQPSNQISAFRENKASYKHKKEQRRSPVGQPKSATVVEKKTPKDKCSIQNSNSFVERKGELKTFDQNHLCCDPETNNNSVLNSPLQSVCTNLPQLPATSVTATFKPTDSQQSATTSLKDTAEKHVKFANSGQSSSSREHTSELESLEDFPPLQEISPVSTPCNSSNILKTNKELRKSDPEPVGPAPSNSEPIVETEKAHSPILLSTDINKTEEVKLSESGNCILDL